MRGLFFVLVFFVTNDHFGQVYKNDYEVQVKRKLMAREGSILIINKNRREKKENHFWNYKKIWKMYLQYNDSLNCIEVYKFTYQKDDSISDYNDYYVIDTNIISSYNKFINDFQNIPDNDYCMLEPHRLTKDIVIAKPSKNFWFISLVGSNEPDDEKRYLGTRIKVSLLNTSCLGIIDNFEQRKKIRLFLKEQNIDF